MSMDRQGLPIPDDVEPIGKRCIVIRVPDDVQHIQVFNGVLMMLQYWYNWERDTEKRGTLVAQVWREVLEDICWKGGVVRAIRQSPNNRNILEWLDCNDVWQKGFDFTFLKQRPSVTDMGDEITENNTWYGDTVTLYDNDVTNLWGDANEIGDGSRDAALCFALKYFIDGICEAAAAAIQSSDENEASRITGIAAAFAGVVSAGLFLYGFSNPAVWVGLNAARAAVGSAIAAVASYFIPDPTPADTDWCFDQESRDVVTCWLFEYLSQTVLDRDEFIEAFTAAEFDEGTPEARIVAAGLIGASNLTAYLSLIRIMAEAYDLSGTGDVILPCPCDSIWCEEWDFTSEGFEWAAWYTSPPYTYEYVSGDRAVYTGSTGWEDEMLVTGVTPNFGYRRELDILSAPFNPTRIISVEVTYARLTKGSDISSDRCYRSVRGWFLTSIAYDAGKIDYSNTATEVIFTYNMDVPLTELGILTRLGRSNSGDPGGDGLLTRVRVRGLGENPFTGNPCT